jgi:hypothetical protein
VTQIVGQRSDRRREPRADMNRLSLSRHSLSQ